MRLSKEVHVNAVVSILIGLLVSNARAEQKVPDAARDIDVSIVEPVFGRALDDAVERATWGQFWGAILVVKDGTPLLMKGYGLARSDGKPMGAGSLFDLASVSKSFTAAAVLKLVESGRVALDDSIEKHVEGVPADKRAITIRHLLQHESGIAGSGQWADDREAMTTAALTAPLRFVPGSRFEYSNVGYFLLAAIIERASGVSFEEYVKGEVLAPAGMASSAIFDDPSLDESRDTDRVVDGTQKVGRARVNPYPVRWGYLGAGGVTATLEDMLRWELALRNGTVLKPDSIAAMFTPSKVGSPEGRYALGWFVRTERSASGNDERVASHTGGVAGFRVEYTRWLDRAQAILVVTNDRNDPMVITRALRDVLEPERRESIAVQFNLSGYDASKTLIQTTNAVDITAERRVAGDGRRTVEIQFRERGAEEKRALVTLTLSPASSDQLASKLQRALAERSPVRAGVTPVPAAVVEVYPQPYPKIDGVFTISDSELDVDVIPGTMHPEEAGDARVTIVLVHPAKQFMPSFIKLAETAASKLVADLRAAGK